MFAGHDAIPRCLPDVVSVTGTAWRIGGWLEPVKRHELCRDVDHPSMPLKWRGSQSYYLSRCWVNWLILQLNIPTVVGRIGL
jgi:hypothetical protein